MSHIIGYTCTLEVHAFERGWPSKIIQKGCGNKVKSIRSFAVGNGSTAHLRRKINLAYDDLYIPATYGIILHGIWLSCTVVAYAAIVDDCSLHRLLKAYTLSVIIILSLQVPLDLIIILLSMSGTVAKPGPRRYLSPFIHLSTIIIFTELAIQCFGIYVAYGPFNLRVAHPGCQDSLPTQSVLLVHMVIAWSFAALCIWFLILFGFLFSSGKSKTSPMEKRVEIWQRRLETFCFRGLQISPALNTHHHPHHHSQHHHHHAESKDVMRDVAHELADLFHDVDWAPEQKRIIEVRQARRLILEQPNGFSLPQLDSSETLNELAAVASASTEVASLAIIGGGPNGTLSLARGYSPTPTLGAASTHSSRQYISSQPRWMTRPMSTNIPNTGLRMERALLNDLDASSEGMDVIELADRKPSSVVPQDNLRNMKRRKKFRDCDYSTCNSRIGRQHCDIPTNVDSDGTTLSNHSPHNRNPSSSTAGSSKTSAGSSIYTDRKTPTPPAQNTSDPFNEPSSLIHDRRPSAASTSTVSISSPWSLARRAFRKGSTDHTVDTESNLSQPVTEHSTTPLQTSSHLPKKSPTSPTLTTRSWGANLRQNPNRSQTLPLENLFGNLRNADDPNADNKFKPWTFRRKKRMNHRIFRRGSTTVEFSPTTPVAPVKKLKGTVTREEIDDILHFARFAEIVYNPDDIAAIIDTEKLVRHQLDNSLFLTPYLIVRDPDTETVVIAVRGTFSTADVLVDLKFDLEDFYIPELGEEEVHYAHSGMLRTARNIVKDIEREGILGPILEDSGSPCFGWPLVVTGHSLGAGVAALVTSCLLSASAATHFESFCTSVIMGDDIVPRVSKNSMEMLKLDVRRVIMNCDHPKWRVFGSGRGRVIKDRPGLLHRRTPSGKLFPEDLALIRRRTMSLRAGNRYELMAEALTEKKGNTWFQGVAPDGSQVVLPSIPMFVPGRILHMEKLRRPPLKLNKAIGGVFNRAIEATSKAGEIIRDGAEGIKDRILDGAEEIKDRILDGADNIKGRIKDGTEGIKDRILDGADNIKGRIKEGTDGIKEKFVGHHPSTSQLREGMEEEAVAVSPTSPKRMATLKVGEEEEVGTSGPFRLWKGNNGGPAVMPNPLRGVTRRRAGSLDTLTSERKVRRGSLGDIAVEGEREGGRIFGRLRRDDMEIMGVGEVDGREQRKTEREKRRQERRARSRSRKRRVGSKWDGGVVSPNESVAAANVAARLRSGRSMVNMSEGGITGQVREEPGIYSSDEEEEEEEEEDIERRRSGGGRRGRSPIRLSKDQSDILSKERGRFIRRRPSAPASIFRMAATDFDEEPPSSKDFSSSAHSDAPAALTEALRHDDVAAFEASALSSSGKNGAGVKVVPLHIAPSNPTTAENAFAAVRRRRASSVASRHRIDHLVEDMGANVRRKSDVDEVVAEVSKRRPSGGLHVMINVEEHEEDEPSSPIELSQPFYPPSSLATKKGKAKKDVEAVEVNRTGKYHYIPRWARKEEFCEIIVSRTMVLDHFPFELLREFQKAPGGSVLGVVTRD
ncbi:hypothetical protein BC829DRAFT_490575 [Chytridium lagenaria]|nr:hypothetical protein BC829DRAFT_490575 [Chytridium lagenaria]